MEFIPWYGDWKFWSAVVAWLSFMMNILPWIIKKTRGTNLSLTAYPSISLTHKVGITNIQWHLRLENNGGTELDISNIDLSIKDDDGTLTIPGKTTYEKNSIDQSILAGFRLKPGETWQGFVCFFEHLSIDDQREFRNIENETRQELKSQGTQPIPPILSPKLINRITTFYLRMFKFKPREYKVKICVKAKGGKEFFFPGYRFTLYESDVSEQISHSNRYMTGEGITWHSDINPWLQVSIIKNTDSE